MNSNYKNTEKSENFKTPITPSSESWDPTPNTCEEMINTYGTYEIQPTNATSNMFPAISQGLPSEDIVHAPSHFREGLVPKLNE